MATLTSKWCHVLCINVVLFHIFGEVHSKVGKFKLISMTGMQNSVADEKPHIRKEFYLCGRDQSCTHVVELSSGFVLVHNSIELEKRKYEALRIYEKVKSQGKSILLQFK